MFHHPLLLPALLLGFGSAPPTASAWQMPNNDPSSALHEYLQRPLQPGPQQHEEDVDIISGSPFSGLKTFANLPYLNCISDDEARDTPYDIAILGAPFDTVGSSP